MKKSLRFASAALAVALAASCAAPAFAAGGSSFTKSETVYAVMNADGSIQSTTVSEHVYRHRSDRTGPNSKIFRKNNGEYKRI